MDSSDYRAIIKAELDRRKQTNSQYSLRAFARDLDLSAAFVSKLLNGQKDLSVDTAVAVATKLGFNKYETKNFCQLVQYSKLSESQSQELFKETQVDSIADSHVLNLDMFQVISDWYHYAILELACCYPHQLNSRFISKKLGIRIDQAVTALQRLENLKLIEFKNGKWIKTNNSVSTPTDVPSRALRNFHSQMIKKAQDSIEGQPVQLRDISGLTIAISEDKIDLAKKEIQNFRRKMSKLMDSNHPTKVYQLNIQFFSLEKEAKNNS
ncbi:MAG: TIGR02147 family protein [Bdellovibrio sp.]